MRDFDNDNNCKNVEMTLHDFFRQYFISEMKRKSARKDDIAFSESVRAYDKMCIVRDKLYKELGVYINSVTNLEDKKYIAGHFLFEVIKLCTDENTKRKNLFFTEGINIISHIAEKFPLTERTRKSICAYVSKNKSKNKLSEQAFEKLQPKKYNNPLEGMKHDEIVPTAELIKEYTGYSYNCALDYPEADIAPYAIFNLLEKNAFVDGLSFVQHTIFDGPKVVKGINKKAVLGVAEVYADNIDIERNYYGENNQAFDDGMEKMFCHIVSNYDYKPEEVEKLKQTLIANSQDQELVKRMAQNIGKAYIISKQRSGGRGI